MKRTKTFSELRGLVAAFSMFLFQSVGAEAVIFNEPPDFANTAPGLTYPLVLGSNIFLGSVEGGADPDYFRVTVPTGMRITLVSKPYSSSGASDFVRFNGETLFGDDAANFTGAGAAAYPLPAATYAASAQPGSTTGFGWRIDITVIPAADYIVSTADGAITVTEHSRNGDTLDISEPVAGSIRFAAAGRTFSVDGGPPIAGQSGDLSLAGVNWLTVDVAAGDDTVNVAGFPGSLLPDFTIIGGTGDDVVNLHGNLTLAEGRDLIVDLQTTPAPTGVDRIVVAAGARLIVNGDAGIWLRCSRDVRLNAGASLEGRYLTLEANQQAAATSGSFIGVDLLAGAALRANSSVTVKGRGGDDPGGFQDGVRISDGATISSAQSVSITGTGGASTGPSNRGVAASGAGTAITSDNNLVDIVGTAGPDGSSDGIGVWMRDTEIRTGGYARVIITGTGAGAAGSGANHGVDMRGAGSRITTLGDTAGIVATAGPGASLATVLADHCSIGNLAGSGLFFSADSISFDETVSVGPAGGVSFYPNTASTVIDLGGADGPGVLGLSNAELDRVTAGSIGIGAISHRKIISSPIVFTQATSLVLRSGDILPAAHGTDVTLPANGTLWVGGPLLCAITGPAPDTGYTRLKLVGKVNLRDATLNLAGTTFPGAAGDTFTLVDNDGADPIADTFRGLPEGAYLLWPGSALLLARISYTGGDGNDAVLKLVDRTSALVVTSAADSGLGTLRDAITAAAVLPGADVITFGALPTQTIALLTELVMNMANVGNVTIDATSVPGGITLSGGGANRVLYVHGTSGPVGSVSLVGLTFISGYSSSIGGAIRQVSVTLSLTRCTLSQNTARGGGGAIYNLGGRLTLTHCTLAQNASSDGRGGALFSQGLPLSVTHCTFSENYGQVGGAVYTTNALTVAHSIVAGNSASLIGPDIYLPTTSGNVITAVGSNLIGSNQTVETPFPAGALVGTPAAPLAAQLAPLGNYGGPTPTMALLAGSPAREAASGSAATSDQRGFSIVGTPDLGAYEAGTIANYDAWSWETLPASATAAERVPGFDLDLDARSNALEFATLTDGGQPSATALLFSARNAAGTEATITIPVRSGIAGLHYFIEQSTTVLTWTPIATINSGLGVFVPLVPGITFGSSDATSITFTDATIAGQSRVFHRLRLQLAQ